MTNKTLKNIRICCYVAIVFCLVWAISSVINTVSSFSSHPIDWPNGKMGKIFVLVCYAAGSIAMIGLCIKAVANVMKGVRENNVFPRSNEKLLFWIALADFVYLLGHLNLQVLWNEDLLFALTPDVFLTPFFLLFFAFMYKVAADAVEENNLTI